MIHDRSYIRQPQKPSSKEWSVVNLLIFITVGIFILQQVLNVMFPNLSVRGHENLFLHKWLSLNGENLQRFKIWTLFSYSFLHSTQSFIHILGNMLGLFFIGRMLEPLLGKGQFLVLYFGGTFLGGLVYIALHFNGNTSVIGASAAIFALLALFCLLRPEQPITLLLFFILPVTLKPRYLFWGSLGISILGTLFHELHGKSQIAHSTHLGGMIAGILFYRCIHQRNGFLQLGASSSRIKQPAWFKRSRKSEQHYAYQVNLSNRQNSSPSNLPKEIDRILDKINTSGFSSLNEIEKKALEQAKDLLNK